MLINDLDNDCGVTRYNKLCSQLISVGPWTYDTKKAIYYANMLRDIESLS